MKKLLLSVSAVVLGLTVASSAMADCNGFYLAGRGGVVKHDYDHKKTIAGVSSNGINKNRLMLSGALGYRYDYFRTELEYVWRDKSEKTLANVQKYSFKSQSGMLNAYFDMAPYSWISPYVSGGIGFTKMEYKDKDLISGESYRNYDSTHFTWSLGAGLTVKVTSRFNVDAGYRYYDMGSLGHADVTAHEIYGGVRYVF